MSQKTPWGMILIAASFLFLSCGGGGGEGADTQDQDTVGEELTAADMEGEDQPVGDEGDGGDGDIACTCTVDEDCDNGLICDGEETCDGCLCRPGSPALGVVCRESAGECDGTNPECPENEFEAQGAPCHGGDGACDGAGTCLYCGDGTCSAELEDSISCPEDCCTAVGVVAETQITDVPYNFGKSHPSLVWTGSEYGVSWADTRSTSTEIYFARISASGSKLDPEAAITDVDGYRSATPSLAWTGTEYGVSWADSRTLGNPEIFFARISDSGVKVGYDTEISETVYDEYPSLVWTGSEYGVSWRNGDSKISFARISGSGTSIGSNVQITTNPARTNTPSLAWTGGNYGVSWQDERDGNFEIYFAMISASGSKLGFDIRITNASGFSFSPSLVWTGSEYGVSWQDDREGNYEIYFARISDSEIKIGSDIRITSNAGQSSLPSLAWTGSEYGLSWQDDSGGNYGIYFVRLSASGDLVSPTIQITDPSDPSTAPSLVWAGSEYGISWVGGPDYYEEIYFARIGCL
jgi:hypothetical protein